MQDFTTELIQLMGKRHAAHIDERNAATDNDTKSRLCLEHIADQLSGINQSLALIRQSLGHMYERDVLSDVAKRTRIGPNT